MNKFFYPFRETWKDKAYFGYLFLFPAPELFYELYFVCVWLCAPMCPQRDVLKYEKANKMKGRISRNRMRDLVL